MSKKLVILLGLILIQLAIIAQNKDEKKKNWIVPTFINLQYAGGIGNYIVGAGYFLNKSESLRLMIQYGFTPKYKTKKNLHTSTISFNALPWKYKPKENIALIPLVGIAVSRVFADGPGTFTRLPSHYPDGYYTPNAFRAHFNIGGTFQYRFKKQSGIRALEFYILTTTNDLYLKYFFKYKPIKINDIFSMAFGININFK
jgi:hypothetical protein